MTEPEHGRRVNLEDRGETVVGDLDHLEVPAGDPVALATELSHEVGIRAVRLSAAGERQFFAVEAPHRSSVSVGALVVARTNVEPGQDVPIDVKG